MDGRELRVAMGKTSERFTSSSRQVTVAWARVGGAGEKSTCWRFISEVESPRHVTEVGKKES